MTPAIVRSGRTPEDAKALMPLCQKCTTLVLRGTDHAQDAVVRLLHDLRRQTGHDTPAGQCDR
jgi:hypothetical protein